MGARGCRRLAELGGADPGLRCRPVAIPAPPQYRPEYADGAEHIERRSPAEAHLHRHDEERRDGSAQLPGQQHDAEGAAALDRWEPPQHAGRCRGIAAGLAGTEEKSHRHQRPQAGGKPGERGERRPPEHHPGEHRAGAEFVAPIPAGDLEQGIGDGKGAGDEPPVGGIQVQVVLQARAGHRNAHAVQIGEHRQGGEQQEHPVALLPPGHGARQCGRLPRGLGLGQRVPSRQTKTRSARQAMR